MRQYGSFSNLAEVPYTNGMTEQRMVNVARRIGATLKRKSGDMNPAVSI
jgi:hypothetical protein